MEMAGKDGGDMRRPACDVNVFPPWVYMDQSDWPGIQHKYLEVKNCCGTTTGVATFTSLSLIAMTS